MHATITQDHTSGVTLQISLGSIESTAFADQLPLQTPLCLTELNLPHTNAGAAFEGCDIGCTSELAAVFARLTRLDLSRCSTPVAAADAASLIGACTALRWLGAPAVREPGESVSDATTVTLQAAGHSSVRVRVKVEGRVNVRVGS